MRPRRIKGCSQAELAEAMGITRQAVAKLIKSGMPTVSVEAAKAWKAERAALTGQGKQSEDIEAAKLRKTIAEADRIETQLAILRGEYTRNDLVQEGALTVGATLSADLAEMKSLAGSLAGLDERGAKRVLEAAISKITTKLKTRLLDLAKKTGPAAVGIALIATGFSAGLREPYNGGIIQWCEENVILPHSARNPEFRRDTAPWLNFPLEQVASDEWSEVVLATPTGGGKTTLVELLLPYIVAIDPGPTLMVGQTDDLAKEWAETRLMPVFDACKPVEELFPKKDRHAKRKTAIIFPHMPLFIAAANMSSLQEKSMRYCIGDEVWRWRPGMIGELRKRHHDRWNRKTLLVSQGADEGHDFDISWLRGTQHVAGFVCPNCNEWHQWQWSNVVIPKTEEGEFADANTIIEGTKYECPGCKTLFDDTPTVRRELSKRTEYRAQNPNAVKGVCSIRWSILCVWWTPWGQVASEWKEAHEAARDNDFSQLRQFINKRLAETWKERDMEPAAELLGGDYRKNEYANGERWEDEAHRFLTVDKQRDHFWAVVRAWSTSGASRLLWEGKLLTWEQIVALAERLKIRPRLVCIDAQFDSDEVYRWCAKMDWTALHGSGDEKFMHMVGNQKEFRFYSPTKRANLGRGLFARYIFWASDPIKDKLYRLRRGAAEPWEIPSDVSADYVAQIDSEVKKDFIQPKTKQVTQRWQKIRRHNHLWDCEAMQVAVAMIVKLFNATA
jgi:transcriptional regulator with XRE-family HTH domain/energy-coupling factor transporter ATP-binding protein EcfA2